MGTEMQTESVNWVTRFIEALHRLEDQGDPEAIVSLFAPEAALWTIVHSEPLRGEAAIREFWVKYRAQFERIHSTFERRIEGDGQAALEWRAEGTLSPAERQIAYRGVTLLRGSATGITEFASYYDPQPFSQTLRSEARSEPQRLE